MFFSRQESVKCAQAGDFTANAGGRQILFLQVDDESSGGVFILSPQGKAALGLRPIAMMRIAADPGDSRLMCVGNGCVPGKVTGEALNQRIAGVGQGGGLIKLGHIPGLPL